MIDKKALILNEEMKTKTNHLLLCRGCKTSETELKDWGKKHDICLKVRTSSLEIFEALEKTKAQEYQII